MDIGLIDVVEWQTTVDLRTGRTIEAQHPLLDLGRRLARAHPYPGDLAGGGDRWVTDVAIALDQAYRPGLICLDYAGLYFPPMFGRQRLDERAASLRATFGEIDRFITETGFEPVIVGLGGLTPLVGQIDTSDLDGVPIAGGMSVRYCGLNRPSERDLQRLAGHPGVEHILPIDDVRRELGGCTAFYDAAPEYIVAAREGWIFRGVNTGARKIYALPAHDATIPVHGLRRPAARLTDIAASVLAMAQERRVALILVEAVGCQTFPLSFEPVDNTWGWYHYAVGDAQYLAIATGRHFVEFPYPPGYRYELYDDENKPYPFSGIFCALPEDAIGRRFPGRTAAVGARAVMTHASFGADITLECFVRALYNHGVMAAIHVPEA
ncbi:MAG TPA: hypothetical protein GX714_09080 [Chloroflexi bacterium]|jgi:hypothetical protein|nr:hypothetical protein [Chloroflexota bacterium]